MVFWLSDSTHKPTGLGRYSHSESAMILHEKSFRFTPLTTPVSTQDDKTRFSFRHAYWVPGE